MNRIGRLVALGGLVAGTSALAYAQGAAAAKRSSFTDEEVGYSIEAPRFPGVTNRTAMVRLMMNGAAANGFAPNVNITVQPVSTTTKAYLADSIAQFQRVGLKLNSERELKVSGRDAVEIDYEGELKPGLKLRFLALAVVEKDRVLLVTATTPIDQFPAAEAELRASLASFQVK